MPNLTPPLLNLSTTAVFCDFDGTLVPIAPTPDAVKVNAELKTILQRLHQRCGGALAIISGRSLDEINRLLNIPMLSAAGCHGLEWQQQGQRQPARGATATELPAALIQHIMDFALEHKLLVENKQHTIAIHFRNNPDKEPILDVFLKQALCNSPNLSVLHGKAIREIKPGHDHKGTAIAHFIENDLFRGRTPVFIGDDVTDEDGFLWVNNHNGVSIKVGPGPSAAQFRLADSAAVGRYLSQLLVE